MGLFGAPKTRFRSQSACMLEHKRSMKLFKHRRSMKGVQLRIATGLRRRWLKDANKRKKVFRFKTRKIHLALWRAFNWRLYNGTEFPF